ncbi:metallophosphoesterase 1 [Megalops cyprinoides]|uniref:metallophosphoesterase 1 n=1 Tax=Megalops cyprinoides TaxID=118141 RepID=UPI0018640998|nr:metallophosphoesterase 1 [Megalops cyprinoides]
MTVLSGRRSFAIVLVVCVSCVFIFCEYLIYFPAILQCSWPETDHPDSGKPVPILHALFLSDTHLLGAIRGHWFDKLRREWQMERAFQTALLLLQPELVFILGDVFDEGKWSSTKDWDDDVRRFRQIFRHPSDTELIVLVGNHDIGFHYEMDSFKLQRFEDVFNITSAMIMTKKGVNFLLVNSVAMHGDGCPICQAVENELFRLSEALNCSMGSFQSSTAREHCHDTQQFPSSPPIILQHYPLFRTSDANCTGQDAAPPEQRHLLFKEQYDVLSREASQKLLWWFQPRLILSGHTHSACEVIHENKYPEISVPSFSWRNRNNPSFILGTFSSTNFFLSKCFLPEESSVVAIYCATAMAAMLLLLAHFHLFKGSLQFTSCLMGKHKPL